MKTKNKALFLHGGPGLHSAVEREWFGDTLPILWWDQPSVAGDPTPFRTLVTHAGRQLEMMAEAGGGQIDLIAHSFGSQITVALVREYPELIRRITLMGCPPDRFRHFFYLARRLLETGHVRPGLQEALAALEENCDENSFFAFVWACYPEGKLPDIYFGPHSATSRDRYFALAAKTPPIDAATFFAVMNEYIQGSSSAQAVKYDGEVKVILGKDDPLLDVSQDRQKWLGIFPQADFKLVDAGHFVHLELPPKEWFQ